MSKKFNSNFFLFGAMLFLISGFIGCGKLIFNDLADTEKIITVIMTAYNFLMVFALGITGCVLYLIHHYSDLLDVFIKILESKNKKSDANEEKSVEEKKD